MPWPVPLDKRNKGAPLFLNRTRALLAGERAETGQVPAVLDERLRALRHYLEPPRAGRGRRLVGSWAPGRGALPSQTASLQRLVGWVAFVTGDRRVPGARPVGIGRCVGATAGPLLGLVASLLSQRP